MQIIVSIFLDLWWVNMQNIRSIAFMQGEIRSEFYLKEKDILREVSNLLTSKMNFLIKKFRSDIFNKKRNGFLKKSSQI